MKAKIKKMNKFILFITNGFAAGITLAPWGIYIKEKYFAYKYKKSYGVKVLINHEKIHWRQQMEMLIVFFYIWYLIEWMVRLITNPDNAYKSISFEQEANYNEINLKYLETRKPFAWLEYLTQ